MPGRDGWLNRPPKDRATPMADASAVRPYRILSSTFHSVLSA